MRPIWSTAKSDDLSRRPGVIASCQRLGPLGCRRRDWRHRERRDGTGVGVLPVLLYTSA